MTRVSIVTVLMALFPLCASALEEVDQPTLEAPQPVIEDIRYAAAGSFLGLLKLDDRGDVDLSGRLYEDDLLARCHPIPWVKDSAVQLFKRAGFRDAGPLIPFPQHGGIQRRPFGHIIDGEADEAVYYFAVSKAATECNYHLGLLVRRKQFKQGQGLIEIGTEKSQDLLDEMKALLVQWKKTITTVTSQTSCPALTRQREHWGLSADEVETWLSGHPSNDWLTKIAVSNVQDTLAGMSSSMGDLMPKDMSIVVFDARAAPVPITNLLGSTCVLIGLSKPTLACDEKFMAFSEVALRVFEESGGSAFTKNSLMTLAPLVGRDPYRALELVRGRMRPGNIVRDHMSEANVIGMMSNALSYYVAHELGHLAACEFGSTFDQPTIPATAQGASLKMCRHLDEFGALGMWMWDRYPYGTADLGARDFNRRSGRELLAADDIYQRRYTSERRADDYAIRQVLDYLSNLDRTSPDNARYEEWMMSQAVFAIGLFSWAQAAGEFGERYCLAWTRSGYVDGGALSECLGASKESQVEAATLFGAVHPFMLLRSQRMLTALVGERLLPQLTDWAVSDEELKTLPDDRKELIEWRQREFALSRYTNILLDGPFKFASIGCTAGERAAHLPGVTFHDIFYSIEQSSRLIENPSLGKEISRDLAIDILTKRKGKK